MNTAITFAMLAARMMTRATVVGFQPALVLDPTFRGSGFRRSSTPASSPTKRRQNVGGYNPGVSLKVLEQTIGSDAKTIRRWGRALRSRDAEELQKFPPLFIAEEI